MRIISLLPSATEVVHALGRGADLVGRSEECDFPPEVRSLPIVMRAKTLDSLRSSAEIDARVRDARGGRESLYFLDLPLLKQLRPDLLLTQDLCGVCSVTESEVIDACRASDLAPSILSVSPRTLEQVWASIDSIAGAIGEPAAGKRFVDRLRQRTTPPGPASPTPRVAVVEWLDPPILSGLWTPDIIERAGGIPLGPASGGVGVRSSWPEIGDLAPDLIVIAPCSFSVERTTRELATTALAGLVSSLNPRLGTWVVDEAYFSRPGPRLADGVELLRSLIAARRPADRSRVSRWQEGVAA
jgi:iron complex transport system substrate-binding protein